MGFFKVAMFFGLEKHAISVGRHLIPIFPDLLIKKAAASIRYLFTFIIPIYPSGFRNKPACVLEAFVGFNPRADDLPWAIYLYIVTCLCLPSAGVLCPTFMSPALLFLLFQTLNFASLYFYLYFPCLVMSCLW